jgi:hypothetical protein
MAENIVAGLFGLTPQMFQNQQYGQDLNRGIAMAQLSPGAAAQAGLQASVGQLGRGFAGAMGIEDPQLKMISTRNAIAQQIDQTNPESILKGAQMLAQAGDQQGAMALAQYARQAQGEMALVQQRKAAEQASLATTAKTQLSIKQEEQLRDELSKLGPNATQEQILSVVTKYGPPDKVMAVLQRSADLAAQRETTLQLGREKIEAKLESDLRQAKTDLEKEQMRIEARKELAQLTAALKGPSAAVLKAQEKAEKTAEGQLALSDTISTAETLVKDLAKMGGMTSTSKGPLANLVTSLQTGTVGQMAGRTFGTQEQAKRDELKSIRLQLLNAVKEATGMSAQQLNSNVELKTYLDSLGSEGMTKEANLAILDNLSRRYLKNPMNAPAKGLGTAENPIVLK